MVIITIKKVSNASGYQVQYSTDRKFYIVKEKTTKSTTYTLKKLFKGKTYYIRIRAYYLDGKKKVYGKWSEVKKVKIKK